MIAVPADVFGLRPATLSATQYSATRSVRRIVSSLGNLSPAAYEEQPRRLPEAA